MYKHIMHDVDLISVGIADALTIQHLAAFSFLSGRQDMLSACSLTMDSDMHCLHHKGSQTYLEAFMGSGGLGL